MFLACLLITCGTFLLVVRGTLLCRLYCLFSTAFYFYSLKVPINIIDNNINNSYNDYYLTIAHTIVATQLTKQAQQNTYLQDMRPIFSLYFADVM